MDKQTIKLLNQINLDFYSTVAINFDSSRQYYWQGWNKILPFLDSYKSARVADIGCGNGRFGQFLQEKLPHVKLSYTGIDANPILLEKAEENVSGKIPAVHFYKKDILTELQSENSFNFLKKRFHCIGVFGLMHHIPSYQLRHKLLKKTAELLNKDGILAVSFWQFMSAERIARKAKNSSDTFAQLGVNPNQVEKNDYILDWKRGTTALRYCHLVDTQEQSQLIEDLQSNSELRLEKSFFADGKEENINSYLILQKQ